MSAPSTRSTRAAFVHLLLLAVAIAGHAAMPPREAGRSTLDGAWPLQQCDQRAGQ
jgi:putative copper export protein